MKLPKQIKIKNKKHFLLIEILIALAIISMLAFPLIRNPLYLCKSQLKSLEKIECETIAELTYLEIKLLLMKKKINLKNIPKYEKEAQIKNLSSSKLTSFKNKEVKRSYKLYAKKEKQTKDDQTAKLVYIKIFLQPKDQKISYSYKYKTVVKY